MWKFLIEFQGTLKFNNLWYRPLNKENDYILMTQVLKHVIDIMSSLLTLPELIEFNLCRLYLQVLTLSDITTSCGREIDINFWKGNRSSCTSNLKWTTQIRPSQQYWTIWRRTLHLLFTELAKSNRLNQQHYLYHWLSHLLSHQQWSHIHRLFHTPAILKTPREPQYLLDIYSKTQVQSHIQWYINTLTPYQQCSNHSL